MMWIALVIGLALGTLAFRLTGLVVGTRLRLPKGVERLATITATVMLAALVVTATLSGEADRGAVRIGCRLIQVIIDLRRRDTHRVYVRLGLEVSLSSVSRVIRFSLAWNCCCLEWSDFQAHQAEGTMVYWLVAYV